MKNTFKLALIALVFVAVSCGGENKVDEPVQAAPAPVPAPVQTAPAPVREAEPESKTKVDINLNTKDGSIGIDVESKK